MSLYPNDQGNPAGAIPVYIGIAPGAGSANLATNASTQVATGPGYVTGIAVNTGGVTSTLKLYDGTSASGTLLGTWSTTAQNSVSVSLPFAVGLFAVTAGGTPADVTISYVT